MSTADFLSEYNGKFSELSKLIKSWNLINITSIAELDKLTEKILNKLYEEQTEIKIKQTIESELCLTYGLYKTEFDSDKLTKQVMTWWNK